MPHHLTSATWRPSRLTIFPTRQLRWGTFVKRRQGECITWRLMGKNCKILEKCMYLSEFLVIIGCDRHARDLLYLNQISSI